MIDYMIMEAVLVKVKKEDAKLQEEAEQNALKKKWRKSGQDLRQQL